jgi:hypothetical protein
MEEDEIPPSDPVDQPTDAVAEDPVDPAADALGNGSADGWHTGGEAVAESDRRVIAERSERL